MCIRDSRTCVETRLPAQQRNDRIAQLFNRHSQQGSRYLLPCGQPVSYTHLDVYKRQNLPLVHHQNQIRLFNSRQAMRYIEARPPLHQSVKGLLYMHLGTGVYITCLLYTSRINEATALERHMQRPPPPAQCLPVFSRPHRKRPTAVSYTHLDVYKRQAMNRTAIINTTAPHKDSTIFMFF